MNNEDNKVKPILRKGKFSVQNIISELNPFQRKNAALTPGDNDKKNVQFDDQNSVKVFEIEPGNNLKRKANGNTIHKINEGLGFQEDGSLRQGKSTDILNNMIENLKKEDEITPEPLSVLYNERKNNQDKENGLTVNPDVYGSEVDAQTLNEEFKSSSTIKPPTRTKAIIPGKNTQTGHPFLSKENKPGHDSDEVSPASKPPTRRPSNDVGGDEPVFLSKKKGIDSLNINDIKEVKKAAQELGKAGFQAELQKIPTAPVRQGSLSSQDTIEQSNVSKKEKPALSTGQWAAIAPETKKHSNVGEQEETALSKGKSDLHTGQWAALVRNTDGEKGREM